MRIWEVEDTKVVPSDLVREQDFILQVRRLHRIGSPTLVINIPLTSIEAGYGGRGPLEEAQERLQAFAGKSGGSYYEMSNGDVFLVWPESEATGVLPDWIMTIVLPGGVKPEDIAKYRIVYRLPDDYVSLRERANHYVEISREATAAAAAAEASAAQILQGESARGPLTAWSADQIEKLLRDIDLHRYLRTQAAYQRNKSGEWRAMFLEIYMSISDLKQAHFPKMEINPSEHLFLELCQTIDQRLLIELSEHVDIITGPNVSLNVSVPSVLGAAFARFVHAIPREKRSSIICELNGSDLWQNFEATLGAMELLRREGFNITIDGITPSMLGYINLARFNADFIKINSSKEHVATLAKPEARAALFLLPRDKIIFFRCDNEQALSLGQDLGITRFQGWIIDDLIKQGC